MGKSFRSKPSRPLQWFATIMLSLSMIREVTVLDDLHSVHLATGITLLVIAAGVLAWLLNGLLPGPRE